MTWSTPSSLAEVVNGHAIILNVKLMRVRTMCYHPSTNILSGLSIFKLLIDQVESKVQEEEFLLFENHYKVLLLWYLLIATLDFFGLSSIILILFRIFSLLFLTFLPSHQILLCIQMEINTMTSMRILLGTQLYVKCYWWKTLMLGTILFKFQSTIS